VLLDLKHLLVEAGQPLPQFLRELAGEEGEGLAGVGPAGEAEGCSYCSGLGHRFHPQLFLLLLLIKIFHCI
jgi:hypothetical protein